MKHDTIVPQHFEAPSESYEPVSGNQILNSPIPRTFSLQDVPEFQRFQAANPGKKLDAKQAALMYGRAIHWMSFLDIIWPNFEKEEWVSLEVAYIVVNDPDDAALPPAFYQQIATSIAAIWQIQLSALYPNGGWSVDIFDDPEITIEAHLPRKK